MYLVQVNNFVVAFWVLTCRGIFDCQREAMKVARVVFLLSAFLCLGISAKADVTILLEEPYSYDGALAGTGHAAVYLTRVCAASPTRLRRCEPGEPGAVISRYHRIAGFDWIAIPLYPYLYAVDRAQDIPLFANAKLEANLRDRYRRKYLRDIVPDDPSGAAPAGDWYELIGSAYDRTLYGFQIETAVDQDEAFIARYNSMANRESYKLVSRNCADFVRNAVNFYYPKAIKRGLLSDLEVSTPKHAAKSLAQYSARHPELQFTTFVIPQVPGTIKRSRPVRGLTESVFKAKKYELPLLIVQPFVAGGFAVAYMAGGRFNPAHDALVLGQNGDLEPPLSAEERRAYWKGLEEMTRTTAGGRPKREEATWEHLLANARMELDRNGRPILQMTSGGAVVQIGMTRDNVLNGTASRELAQELLVARIREELRSGGPPKTSAAELRKDWNLLKAAFSRQPENLEASGHPSSREVRDGSD